MSVSRETIERLEHYAETLRKWNPKINLVAKSTLEDLWERHIEDSLQIIEHIPEKTVNLVDIGSGGGFPGLVIAIAAKDLGKPKNTTLIESDQRKCAFLRTVLRETGAAGDVLTVRIEDASPQGADVLTARALADLTALLSFAERHLSPNGIALFLKGQNWRNEIADAEKTWKFEWNAVQSKTNPEAALLVIKGLTRA